jgi:hypothetical protein
LRRFILAAAVLVAAAALFFWSILPPRRLTLSAAPDDAVAGVIHVHSVLSDGRGTSDEIADAAARAGLKFVVITDHGDATRTPEPAAYRHGVLCFDAVEISTSGGHYIALDMPASPYPLGGEARDVVDDVKRLGGFGIVAHPDSPKEELRWREWDAPFDAIEIANLDTAWRQRATADSWRSRLRLVERLLSYPFRPAESIASLMQPSRAWQQWAAISARRRVVTLAGADAHARIGLRTSEPVTTRASLPVPSYVASFRTLSVHVRLERALTGDAGVDARMIMRGIRAGHAYTAVDGAASPASFDLTAGNDHGTVHAGDELAAGDSLTLRVRSNAPAGFTTQLWRGNEPVRDSREPDFSFDSPQSEGVYRVSIQATGQLPGVPWLVSNPIYVRTLTPTVPPATAPATPVSLPLFDGHSLAGWTLAQDPTSLGAVDPVEIGTAAQPALRWRFGLASGAPAGQYAALIADLPRGAAASDRVAFTVRAERPMRISVQLSAEKGRWQRSVYIDTLNRDRTVLFDDMRPADPGTAGKPPLADVRSLMFVVDTTNTKPGTSGRIWIANPALQK